MSSTIAVLSIEDLNKLARNIQNEKPGDHRYEKVEHAQQLWSSLIVTVYNPSVSEKHMTAACNAICFVARKCSRSACGEVREFSLSGKTWTEAFHAARCAFASGKNKPGLQILDTLAYLAETNPKKELIAQSLKKAATEMVKIVFNQQPKKTLKEACIVLYFFLRKLSDFMSFSDVLEQAFRESRKTFSRLCNGYGIQWKNADHQTDLKWLAFVLSLLMATRVAESRSATLKLLSLFGTLSASRHGVDPTVVMNKAIDVYSAADETALGDVSRDVLPSILTNLDRYHVFLSKQTQKSASTVSEVQVVLVVLEFGKRQGFIGEGELPTIVNKILFSSGDLGYAGFENLLSHGSAVVRLRSCELLVSSNSPKARVPGAALTCLAESLQFLHGDTDAFHRGELLSIFRRFLTRLSVSRSVVDRSQQSEYLSCVDGFLNSYTKFLRTELAPHLSYGRHILALDLICFVAEISTHHNHPFPYPMMANGALLSSLFRLVLDPYDDVRITAAQALSHTRALAATDPAVATTLKDVIRTLKPMAGTSKLAAATNRADHADALGRIISLMQGAEALHPHEEFDGLNGFNEPDNGLQSIVQQFCAYIESVEAFDVSTQYPLHGNILGISYVVRSMKPGRALSNTATLQQSLLDACQRVWMLSQAHLCVDSPEMEIDLAHETTSSGPKDALAYAWRALRDSNLLMQAMLETYSPEMHLLQIIGSLCFEQLALLRHRGAFSTVAQTFLLCCQKARNSEDERSHVLIGHWFSKALDELEGQAEKLTRRSAGLPAMFTALLHQNSHEQFFAAFQALVKIAMQITPQAYEATSQDRLRLPQVHALNCIKDIMMTSRFRTMTEPLVISTINMAAQSMGSSIWAIKNCGLMLLSASINRLDPETSLGASEAGLKTRGTMPMALRPLEIALALLQTEARQTSSTIKLERDDEDFDVAFHGSAEGEFAGLDLLGRLYMGPDERTVAKVAVTQKLGHRLWHIRAQAARLLTDLTLQGEDLTTLQKMLSGFESCASINECHGRLLVAQYLLRSMQENLQIQDYLTQIIDLLVGAAVSPNLFRSRTTLAVWLELATESYKRAMEFPDKQRQLCIALEQHILSRTRAGEQADALCNRASGLFLSSVLDSTALRNARSALLELISDEDVALHVFSHLQPPMPDEVVQPLLGMLVRVMSSKAADDIRASAMNAASSFLQHTKAGPLEMVDQIDFHSLVSRNVQNAQLKLYTNLAAQLWLQHCQGGLSQLKRSAKGFCLHLRLAANDELEDTTRRAAVDALLAWKGITDADQMLQCLCGRTGELQVMSVLYDLLNDDDDEIRLAAAEATATLLNSDGLDMIMRTDRAPRTFCAAASRHKLREQIGKRFGDSGVLGRECWRRILGINTTVSSFRLQNAISAHVERNGVDQQLSSILAAANDLFAEEKQNLYVDEIDELRVWADMVVTTKGSLMSHVHSAVVTWVTDGLRVLANVLLNGDFGPSMHYGADFEMLLIRVVTIGRIVGMSEKTLKDLQKHCIHSNMSETVLSAFTWSLGRSQNNTTRSVLAAVVQPGSFLLPSKVKDLNSTALSDLTSSALVSPSASIMAKYNVNLFLCILFVIPLVVFIAWKVWVWCILQQDLLRIEEGLRRQQAGMPAAVGPALAEPAPAPPPAP